MTRPDADRIRTCASSSMRSQMIVTLPFDVLASTLPLTFSSRIAPEPVPARASRAPPVRLMEPDDERAKNTSSGRKTSI